MRKLLFLMWEATSATSQPSTQVRTVTNSATVGSSRMSNTTAMAVGAPKIQP